MSRFLAVDWAPLSIPLERRLQTLAVLYFCLDYLILSHVYIAIMFGMLFTPLFPLPLIYCVWWIHDRKSPERGGHRWRYARKWTIFKYAKAYFPVQLVTTCSLDPNRNYIFGTHPHGIFALTNLFNMLSDDVDQQLPGLRISVLTLKENFMMPIHRELLLAAGCCSVSRESIEHLLTNEGVGNVVNIVPGGAAEALDAVPGTCDLTLKSRKGFVRMALKYGADLVPVISFGENELFDVVKRTETSLIRRFQKFLIKTVRFTIPVFRGRGVFQYSIGILPFRKPITTVIGKPIKVNRTESEPTLAQVDALHAKYCLELQQLYDARKAEFNCAHVPMVFK
jgi:2-acylglycerol O-acyltransferase 2